MMVVFAAAVDIEAKELTMAISLEVGCVILLTSSDSCDLDFISEQSGSFWVPVLCFRFGGGVEGNLLPTVLLLLLLVTAAVDADDEDEGASFLLLYTTEQGGVVGGVILRSCHGSSPGGDNVTPGEGGGMELHELRLEAAESTFGMVFVVGVVGHPESESLILSFLGEMDSSLRPD